MSDKIILRILLAALKVNCAIASLLIRQIEPRRVREAKRQAAGQRVWWICRMPEMEA